MKKLLILALLLAPLCAQARTLNKEQAAELAQQIYKQKTEQYVTSFQKEWADRLLTNGDYRMPFWYKVSGEKPAAGYPMYISMHGGGGTTPEKNNGQWSNQKRLYGTVGGLYWVPRAPTDTWNLWHQEYMEDFLLKAVTYAVEKMGVDPNRVYIMGYSAGGDGTFNLASRLADRFAAAAMMAGHPGDAEAENLLNIPFAIYMGGKDGAYDRNLLAAKWGENLDSLQKTDPQGFTHRTVIYPELGHWMNNNDKEAIGWLAQYSRKASNDRVVWIQDDVTATRKYALEVPNPKQGQRLEVKYDGNTATIVESDYPEVTLWFNDDMVDLDKPVTIIYKDKVIAKKKLARTSENIAASIDGRYDSARIFPAKITVKLGGK